MPVDRLPGRGPLDVESKKNDLPQEWRWWLLVVIGFYVISLLITRPDTYIDSFSYATHIVDHRVGAVDPSSDPFWDFGHALWRPMGYLVYICAGGPLTAMFAGNQIFAAAASLIVWSIAGALFAAVILYLLVVRLTGRPDIAALVTIGFISTHAVMNFQLTGCAYLAGISCQVAALYYVYTALQVGRTALRRAIVGGLLLGFSVCIWFPFILLLPGYLCFALLWRDQSTELPFAARLRVLATACLAVAVVVAAVYLPVMTFRQIRTGSQFRQWMETNRYGIQPTRGFARMLFGVPRGFLWLGEGNSVLKQALLHPRRGATADVLRVAWKPVAVYLVLAVLVFRLRTSDWGRRMLVCLSAAAIPVVIFAAFLFDPSPPERYLGIYPLLFASIGLVLARQPWAHASRIIFVLFFGAMMATNLWAMWGFWPETGNAQQTIARLESVNRQVSERDLILFPSFQDDGLRFVDGRPFHPASRFRLNLLTAVPIGKVDSANWKPAMSKTILATWQHGGRVWLSARMIQENPSPQWWIEGDENRVRWAEVSRFYRGLDIAESVGGEDGFLELAQSPHNLALLQEIANR
jgi:chromate transport protein ChrA